MVRFEKAILAMIVGIVVIYTSLEAAARSRDDFRREHLAKQKRIDEVRMMDLGIDSPPKIDRNAIGALGHHAERTAEKQFTIYSYPRYFFGMDGTLQLSDVKLRPSEKSDILYEMEDAVYRFYVGKDGSYWIFHYGMWMYFYINDIGYMDRDTGSLYSFDWKPITSVPSVQTRSIEWAEIFPGVGLRIELSEDFVKESILLSESARRNLPDPNEYGLQSESADIVVVYDFVMDDLCDEYVFPDFDLREEYGIADSTGIRAASENYAINGELTFSRKGKVRHKFLRDEALLPGYIDRDLTPELRTEVKKYWQNTKEDKILLSYGIPYSIHEKASSGTIIIDPTIKFQEGISSYSGSYMTQIRGDAGFTDYNYGRDTMLKVADNVSGTKWRSLVKFDLSSISHITANNILSASVKLRFSDYYGTLISRNASAYQIKRDWNEGNSAQGETPNYGEATWDEAKYNQTSWSTAGCDNTTYDRNSTADDTTSLTTTVGNWNEWDITDSVKSWLNNSLSNNYGVLIRPNWTSSYPEFIHNSDDAATGSYRPKLVVYVKNAVQPWHDDWFEYFGDDRTLNDGIVFKKNGSPTNTFEENDTINLEWTLTTNQSYSAYGCGQFLRIWIDIDADGIYDESEEVTLKYTDDTSDPYVIESHKDGDVCTGGPCVTKGEEVNTYTLPDTDELRQNTFTYKFTVPAIDVVGNIETTVRVFMRFQEWPNDDPAHGYEIDDFPNNCDGMESPYGDVEDHSIELVP